MADIFDLVSAKSIGEYIETVAGGEEPLLGATLFPAKKILGLDLKFIKGYNKVPVVLRPSSLGSRAYVRDRIGGVVIQNELPFFREKMLLPERLRQELARVKQDATDPYTQSVVEQVFDDAKTLVDGANAQAERERFQLLFTGGIDIQAPSKDGRQPYYLYNYDTDSKWDKENVTLIDSRYDWVDTAHSEPLKDILAAVEKASAKGVKLTRAIVNPVVWSYIMRSESIKSMFTALDGSYRVFGRNQLLDEIETITGVRIAIYGKSYVDEDGRTQFYAPDTGMVLLPDGALGSTVYGTTPEELDLMAGFGNAVTSVVNTGVAVTTSKQYGPPVTVETVVSELVLPSFERMSEVYVIRMERD